VISTDGRGHRVLGHGVIVTSSHGTLEQRLKIIAAGLRNVLAQHQPDAAAVEEVFYSQNVKTALKLAHVRGVALLAIGLPWANIRRWK
jgi:crossover junction endodeoxyribonuclease RuvC